VLVLLLGAGACHKREGAPATGSRSADSARVTGVALVDSVPLGGEPGSGTLRRVEVRLGTRRDTVPGVLTFDPPGVLGDTAVVGFAYDQESVTGVFVYSPARHSVTRRDVVHALSDFSPSSATPTFAPDGQSFVYIAYDSGQDSLRPTLRHWPTLDVVATGPGVLGEAMDAGTPYATEWHGRDTAVATFSFGGCPAPLLLRILFMLAAERMRSDTVLQLDEPAGTRHWWPWSDSVPVRIPGIRAWLVASTGGPGLGPGVVIAIRGGGIAAYADSIHDVDFQLEGRTCPGVPVSGPQDARDAFLGSVADTMWSPVYQVAEPNRREDYGSPPHVISYRWSEADHVVRKAIAWNFRTRHFDVLAPPPADSGATP
jgi:hypothetical protein